MNGLRLTLILWLFFSLASWPSSLAAPSDIESGSGLSGGRDESYLSVARGPEWLSDLAGIDSVARQHQVMAVVVEPETETQTRATHYHGEGAWEREAPRTGDRGLRQPSTRGALRVYVTHYSAPIGATIASEHPAGFRPGICATYAVRDETRRIVGAHLPGHGALPFGTIIHIGESDNCALWDTGTGYADGRAWLDIAVASDKAAKELGAGWREVEVLEGGSHD